MRFLYTLIFLLCFVSSSFAEIKSLSLPYLTRDITNGWASAVVIVNEGDIGTIVEYTYNNTVYGGTRISRKTVNLEPQKSFIFVPEYEGRYRLRIVASDEIEVVALIFGSGGITNVLPKERLLKPTLRTNMEIWPVSPFWEVQGNTTCNYLRADFQDAIRIATIKTHYQDESKEPLVLYDGCPLSGICPNHPGNSHGDHGLAQDIKYFEHDGSFDVERQDYFFSALIQADPKIKIRTHSLIIAKLKNCPLYDSYKSKLIADDNPNYNHDTHAHLEQRE